MEFRKLQKEAQKNVDIHKINLKVNTPEENAILVHTVKLNEEVGELCNDILSILRLQRKEKLKKFEKKNMYKEFADVMITLMQLATLANVDLERAVLEKLKTIEERFKADLQNDK